MKKILAQYFLTATSWELLFNDIKSFRRSLLVAQSGQIPVKINFLADVLWKAKIDRLSFTLPELFRPLSNEVHRQKRYRYCLYKLDMPATLLNHLLVGGKFKMYRIRWHLRLKKIDLVLWKYNKVNYASTTW